MSSLARFLSDDELLQIRQLYLESLETEDVDDASEPPIQPVAGDQPPDDSAGDTAH